MAGVVSLHRGRWRYSRYLSPCRYFFCCPGYYKNNGIHLYYNANKYIYQDIFTRKLNFFLAASLIKMADKAKGRFTLTKSAFIE